MLIINADDWGRSVAETDAALRCFKSDRINSVSAMVFMADSDRAAELARENNVNVGLHLNFTEPFSGQVGSTHLLQCHERIRRFLRINKYAQLLYNPLLANAFSRSCSAQFEEFRRLFGKHPSHVDGHHHMHLCSNMLIAGLVPAGVRMRPNFSFWPGEKSWMNRVYRYLTDLWLSRRYRLADYFFDLTQCIRENKLNRVQALAKSYVVELMTHPIDQNESEYLMSDQFKAFLQELTVGTPVLV